ncbi:MAG: prolyl oligopeptidase family serine peptidase, partial [Pseudomonadota bacterium]
MICSSIFAVMLSIMSSPAEAETNHEYATRKSKESQQLLRSEIFDRWGELNTVTPSAGSTSFYQGFLKLSSGNLLWTDSTGTDVTLVDASQFEPGYGIAKFLISPDGSKVAYARAFKGQDLRFWDVVTISKEPQTLTKTPIENRMQGFTWNSTSDGLYYSFWNDKDKVDKGVEPIIEQRFRSLNTAEDKSVFDHGLAENFEIVDIGGDELLVAYRVLNPAFGIKTTFSMYTGEKQSDGSYRWARAYERNEHVAVFLGVRNGKAYILSSEAGDKYGIVVVDFLNGGSKDFLFAGREDQVLHTAELSGDHLILQYHSIPEQNVSLEIWNLENADRARYEVADMGLTPFGNLMRFNFGPGGKTARSIYSDVFRGNQVLELSLENMTLRRLSNEKDLDFDFNKVEQRLVSFTAEDGTLLTGRLYSRKGEDPTFAFMRYYGWISIKNAPEQKEVQMVLELGGAYLTLDMPGGGERGHDWFIKGSRFRHKMIRYISEFSRFTQKELNLPKERIAAMGRSWGGLTTLILAANYGDNFGILNSVVPVIDLKDGFFSSWFGRIAHSDLAPYIDGQGDYILDDRYYRYVESLSPAHN